MRTTELADVSHGGAATGSVPFLGRDYEVSKEARRQFKSVFQHLSARYHWAISSRFLWQLMDTFGGKLGHF